MTPVDFFSFGEGAGKQIHLAMEAIHYVCACPIKTGWCPKSYLFWFEDFLGREGKQDTLNEIQTILSLSQRLLFAGWNNHQKFKVPIVEVLSLIRPNFRYLFFLDERPPPQLNYVSLSFISLPMLLAPMESWYLAIVFLAKKTNVQGTFEPPKCFSEIFKMHQT